MSPAGPGPVPSPVRPLTTMMLRNITAGEVGALSRLTKPLSPNRVFRAPVFASSVKSLELVVPTTSSGGVVASPGKYSTPRVDGLPVGSL